MEENNYKHEKFDDCFLCNHPTIKHILVGVLVFLGAFAAFYVVSDWHFKRMLSPAYQMRQIDRAMMKREKSFDKMERRALRQQEWLDKKAYKAQTDLVQQTAQFIHVEKMPDAYRITIDLRPFDNNEKNIEITTQGNTLTLKAAGEKNVHHKKEILRYSQTFAFGEDIDTENITKVKEGNNYIITIPFD